MNWQERTERYLTEQKERQRQVEQEREEAERAERETKLRIAQEKIPPLIEALKSLPVVQLLTEIRNDEWKCGNIEVYPGEITSDTPIKAAVKLSFIVAENYVEQYWGQSHSEGPLELLGGYTAIIEEAIEISTKWSYEGDRIRLYGEVENSVREPRHFPFPYFLYADDLSAASAIEEWLIEIVAERKGWKNPPPFERYAAAKKPQEKTGLFRKLFSK